MNNRIRINDKLYEAVTPRNRSRRSRSLNESTNRKLTWKDMNGLGLTGGMNLSRSGTDEYRDRAATFTNGDPGLYFENDEAYMIASGDIDWLEDGDPESWEGIAILPKEDDDVTYQLEVKRASEAKHIFDRAIKMFNAECSASEVANFFGFDRFN